MKRRAKVQDNDLVSEAVKAKQRYNSWPSAMANSRSVAEFLWKGSPDATLIQRMGAWILGLFFILIGVGFAITGSEQSRWFEFAFLFVVFLIGGKVFLNGFHRHRGGKPKVMDE